MKAKKLAAIIFALLMVFSISVSAFAEDLEPPITPIDPDPSVTIASIIFQNFYSSSGGSTITLSQAIHYISVKVTCASGNDGYMTASIDDLSHGGAYDTYFTFPANGSTTTVSCYLPAGSYSVTLLGTYKLHTYGFVAFSTSDLI